MMKKPIALLLALSLLLCGCAGAPAETEPTAKSTVEAVEPTAEPTVEANAEPATEPTTVPTTEPETVYHNPLTGEELEEPVDTRIFAVTINNLEDALPHYGVLDADIFMEMFVNGSVIRGLALFTDPSSVPAIGSVRSTRFMFSDISIHYDAVLAHAGGSSTVLSNAKSLGVDSFNIDTWDSTSYSFRDMDRSNAGYSWEHCLFAKGDGLMDHAVEEGIDISQDPEKDYLLRFTEDGTPDGGETADSITVTFISYGKKSSTMQYDANRGQYIYYQYGQEMLDGATGEPEAFQNVIIMLADIHINQHGYHEADFVAGGEGYFACGGKIIPIRWGCDAEDQPFYFTTMDGEPLNLGVGNSYIAVAPLESTVVYE